MFKLFTQADNLHLKDVDNMYKFSASIRKQFRYSDYANSQEFSQLHLYNFFQWNLSNMFSTMDIN